MGDTTKPLILAEPWRIALQEMFDALPFSSKNSIERGTEQQQLLINGKCFIHSALLSKNSRSSFKYLSLLLYFNYV